MSIIQYQESSGEKTDIGIDFGHRGLGPEAVARPLQQVKLAETGEAWGPGDEKI